MDFPNEKHGKGWNLSNFPFSLKYQEAWCSERDIIHARRRGKRTNGEICPFSVFFFLRPQANSILDYSFVYSRLLSYLRSFLRILSECLQYESVAKNFKFLLQFWVQWSRAEWVNFAVFSRKHSKRAHHGTYNWQLCLSLQFKYLYYQVYIKLLDHKHQDNGHWYCCRLFLIELEENRIIAQQL